LVAAVLDVSAVHSQGSTCGKVSIRV